MQRCILPSCERSRLRVTNLGSFSRSGADLQLRSSPCNSRVFAPQFCRGVFLLAQQQLESHETSACGNRFNRHGKKPSQTKMNLTMGLAVILVVLAFGAGLGAGLTALLLIPSRRQTYQQRANEPPVVSSSSNPYEPSYISSNVEERNYRAIILVALGIGGIALGCILFIFMARSVTLVKVSPVAATPAAPPVPPPTSATASEPQ